MKNILIPTDFTVKSLKLINRAVEHYNGEELNILLVHALEPDHSISGLLLLNKRLNVHRLYTDQFQEACEVLRNKYASVIRKIKIEFYYGSTRSYLNNFLEARNIDAILFAGDYELSKPSVASRDALQVWGKCNYPVIKMNIQWNKDKVYTGEHSLSELLHT